MFTSAFRFQFVWRVTSYRLEKSPHLKDFNPHPPHGGWLYCKRAQHLPQRISIHTLRMEGDLASAVYHVFPVGFQSTPSAWRVTWLTLTRPKCRSWFQSTPSAWRVTGDFPLPPAGLVISTPSAWRVTQILAALTPASCVISTPSAWRVT